MIFMFFCCERSTIFSSKFCRHFHKTRGWCCRWNWSQYAAEVASRLLLCYVYVNVSESSGQGCSCCRVIEQINSKHNEVDLLSMSTRFYCALSFFSHPRTPLCRAISITLDNKEKLFAELRIGLFLYRPRRRRRDWHVCI